MTSDEVEALDKKLAEALTLLYDREFAEALSLFKEISGRVETMDILFWTASAAAGAGETDLALGKYQEMLAIDGDLHRVRLEMANLYFRVGRYAEARKELERVLEAEPPEAVKNNVQKLLVAIKEKTKRLFTNLRFTLGVQRDSNVSAGPDKEYIDVPQGGVIGPLTNTQKKLSDWVVVDSLTGNALYDFGEKKGWMWNTTGSLYQTHNLKYHEFDYTQWRMTTGPWLVGRRGVLKVPVGYEDNTYEHEGLYDAVDFSPSYEYFFTPTFSIRYLFSYREEKYEKTSPPAEDESGQNANQQVWELNPNIFLNNRKDVLSFFISIESVNTKEARFAYNAYNVAVSYFKPIRLFSWDLEFYSRYKYSSKNYDTQALLWPAGYERKDEKHNFYFALTKNFWRRYFTSISFNYINNESNTDLYTFDKYIYGMNMGVRF
jgi:tetratricopeptide (TPR) repeat protein